MSDRINSKLVIITIISGLACYCSLLVRIYNMWMRDSRMDYIPFVLLLFGLLIRERYRKGIKSGVSINGNWLGIPVIAIGLLCDVAGIQTSIMSLSVLSLIICFSGSVLA